jgi:hypothetical protein
VDDVVERETDAKGLSHVLGLDSSSSGFLHAWIAAWGLP